MKSSETMKPCINIMVLNAPIETLPRTSPITIKKFKSLDINSFYDLLNLFPNRYENYFLISNIKDLQAGEIVTVKGIIEEFKNTYTKKHITIQKARLTDNTGYIELVWYNQPYLSQMIKKGTFFAAAGLVKQYFDSFSLETREYEILRDINDQTLHTGRIVPVYPEKRGLSSHTIREKIFYIVKELNDTILPEWLTDEIITYNNLMPLLSAYKEVHFPSNQSTILQATERLSFDELFTIQLSAQLIKKEWQKEQVGHMFSVETPLMASLQTFIQNLPFPLTGAQNRVVNEILDDLKKPTPMNRFVQGDVGSGKTVVAAIATYLAHLNGFQSLLMAPTEILAQQHYQTISKLFENYNLKIGLQTGSKKIVKKSTDRSKPVPTLPYDVVIGTHALLNDSLQSDKIGHVIIDEQHRFGVVQRAQLKQKGINPHLLTMTATPIPRTVMLTLYGELDLSVIDEMPKGRLPIKTFVVPPVKRSNGYEWIKKQIQETQCQVFIICPLIEELEGETLKSMKAATKEYEHLQKHVFPKLAVGLLHGKMKPKEKEQVMQDFKNKKYDILVSTSVVEVGIDVPNATIMIIEGAERFGLAQLHQLRGRVGRGENQSYCFLYTETPDQKSSTRLHFFATTNSGLALAEYDFKLRGPGDVYGKRQHGYADLKIAKLSDTDLIQKTKSAASYFANHYQIEKYPDIQERIKRYDLDQISRD